MPRRRNSAASGGALGRGGGVEGRAEPAVAGVDAERPTGLGIDERQLADVDERVLARVDDLDGEDRVAAGDRGQRRRRQSTRAAEVRDDRRRGRPVVRDVGDRRGAPGPSVVAPPPSSGASVGERAEQAEHPVAAAGRRA